MFVFLFRFVLTVRRGYRDPPYHNWVHAWTVAHFSYLLLKNTEARSMLKYACIICLPSGNFLALKHVQLSYSDTLNLYVLFCDIDPVQKQHFIRDLEFSIYLFAQIGLKH